MECITAALTRHSNVKYYIFTGSGVDFDSSPINITFDTGEVIKSVNISVMCDKIASEGRERFYISLMLTSRNFQARIGSRHRASVRIRDHTGN